MDALLAAAFLSTHATCTPQDSEPIPQDSAPMAVTATEIDEYGAQASQFLLSVSGSYEFTNYSDLETEDLRIALGLGYFVSRAHEVGIDLFAQYRKVALDLGGGSRGERYILSPYYNYNHFLSPRLSIFGGAHADLYLIDDDFQNTNDVGWGLQVGARYWITPRVSFEFEPRWTVLSGEVDADLFDTTFGINVVL